MTTQTTIETTATTVHKFEAAGLGTAPFRVVGWREMVNVRPDGTRQPGGSCDYCGTGIVDAFFVRGADGRTFKVGCDCVKKTGDAGLVKACSADSGYRRAQADKRRALRAAKVQELARLLDDRAADLDALPHPRGFTNRKTGAPLTARDWAEWMWINAGTDGRIKTLAAVKKLLA